MRTIWSRMPALAAVTGVIMVTSGLAGTAWSASAASTTSTTSRHEAAVITRTAEQMATDHNLAGNETSVSCLSASRCVAVGSRSLHGVVVTLTNGQQSHAAVLRRSSVIYSVSCRKSGCWAIGRPDHGTGAYLVKISTAGRPVAERTLPVPRRTTLGPISCASPTSCEIAGASNRISPSAIEIGDWNGKNLRLHQVTVKGSKRMSMAAISCWHSNCEAVGVATVGPGYNSYQGLILTTASGKPARLNADSGYPDLDGVSCVSARTCYAVSSSFSAVTVTRGVVTSHQSSSAHLIAIECIASDCEAAGWIPLPQYSTQDGYLINLSNGTLGASIQDGNTCSFTGIAARGDSGGFIAIGTGPNCYQNSVVAVG